MSTQEDILRLRQRMNDLLSMGVIEGDSAGTYQQTLLQILREAESRKLQCDQLAQSLEVQLHQARAQGIAFGMVGNLIYSVVNGMASKEEQRIQETQERERQKAEEAMPPTLPKGKPKKVKGVPSADP